jgi:hypothetical protein
VIVLEDVSLKTAVEYVAAPENCGNWLTVVYGGVTLRPVRKR